MVDEIIAIADALPGSSGWPEGWIAVRRALRRYKDMPDAVRENLSALEQRLKPRDLPAMIRTYAFSPEWGALDIADLEEDEEHKPVEARERVYDLCNDLGQQLARDPAQLSAMLPEIVAANSSKTFYLGQGIAAACVSLSECWKALTTGYLSSQSDTRSARILGGFLAGAMGRSPDQIETLLDEALEEPRLTNDFVYLQLSAGITDHGYARMIRALKDFGVPASSFHLLAGGRAHEAMSDDQLHQLLRMIWTQPAGTHAACEILGMRIYGRHSEKLPVSEVIKATGRALLSQLDLKKGTAHDDHMIGQLVQASYDGAEHDDEVRNLCARILNSVRTHQINRWDLGEMVGALTKNHPIAVLDILVEQASEDEDIGGALFEDFRSNRACPLKSIAPAVWLEWAALKPDSRYALLAGIIRFSSSDNDEPSNGWSEAATQLINTAPDPAKVLDVFFDRFQPMGWSGSRAVIMASRLPMIEALKSHNRSEVAAWATTREPNYTTLIAQERTFEASRDRRQHETFE
jgi:hypothetical protein